MKQSPLEEFEQDIITAGGNLYLSNYRIRYYKSGIYYSIRLSEISYVEYERRKIPQILNATLTVCGIIFLIGMWNYYRGESGVEYGSIFIVLIIGLLIYYFFSVKTIKFSSSGGGISVNVNSLTDIQIDKFIEHTESAIFEYNNRKPVFKVSSNSASL